MSLKTGAMILDSLVCFSGAGFNPIDWDALMVNLLTMRGPALTVSNRLGSVLGIVTQPPNGRRLSPNISLLTALGLLIHL